MCAASLIWEWWDANAPSPEQRKLKYTGLPLDTEGQCIFHSRDVLFKATSNFTQRFREWVAMSFKASSLGCEHADILDCTDFVFVGEEVFIEGAGEQNILDLSELQFGLPCQFVGAEFFDETWFNYAVFVKRTDFEGCSFSKTVHFENAHFEARVIFASCIFSEDSGFRETVFQGGGYFTNCIFTGPAAFNETVFECSAGFVGSSFQRAFFHGVQFRRGINDGVTNFDRAEFKELVQFRGCEFSGEANFAKCSFSTAEFQDVAFSSDRLTNFDRISVVHLLTFKSPGISGKVFNHTVSFDVDAASISGRVVFENANVYHIAQMDRLRLLAAPGIGKVVFGPGCDKYRLRVEFELPLEKKWKFLLEEMLETFVIFFDWSGKIPVQVNVECEYLEDRVLVRYFADSDITQEAFAGLLGDRVPDFIELLKDPFGFIDRFRNRRQPQEVTGEQITLDYDLFRKAWALQLGLLPRVQLNALSESDFQVLFQALAGNRYIKELTINLHQNLVQKDLFSIGSRKYMVGGNMTLTDHKP